MSYLTRLCLVFSLLLASCNFSPEQSRKASSSTSAVDFASWNFVLWDYADEVTTDPKTAQQHWQTLIGFIQKNNIRRVITLIKDPSHFPFYDLNQTPADQYFIYWALQLSKMAPNCDLQVFFDKDSFKSIATPIPPFDLPDPFHKLTETTFANLPDKMSWVSAMLTMHVPIKEIDLDPECDPVFPDCDPSNSKNIGGPEGAKQLLINYMNYFRNQNKQLANIRLGVCFGFDMKPLTFANLSRLPLPNQNDEYNIESLLLPNCNFYNFPTKIDSNWWGANNHAPLLDSVYIEAYDTRIPYNFTLQKNPSLAAAGMLHLFRDEPYMPGAGTISYTKNVEQVTGSNTNFKSIVTDGTPFGIGSVFNIALLGRVNGSTENITDTEVTFYSGATATGNNTPYFLSESPVKWIYPSIDPAFNPQLAQNICLMFSFEPNPIDRQNFQYFGNWTLDAFLEFMTNFYSFGQTTLPIYTKSSDPDPTTYVPLPENFGVYDFRQLQANPAFKQLFP